MQVIVKPSPVPFPCDTVLAAGGKWKRPKGPASSNVVYQMTRGLGIAHRYFAYPIP